MLLTKGVQTISPRYPPSGAGGSATKVHEELLERAAEATRVLRDLVPCSAFQLSAWNPISGTHLHRELASDGYSPRTIAYANDDFVKHTVTFQLLHDMGAPRVLRWRDMAREWRHDVASTATAQEFLMPEGFYEGSTVCLRLRDGRYTGSLHVSWPSTHAATDERRETIERFCPVLATVCDMLRTPRILVETLAPGSGAIIVSREGVAAELTECESGTELSEGSALRTLLSGPGIGRSHRRFLWAGQERSCHRIEVIPCLDSAALVTEQRIPWPYGLTPRELQVLHVVAEGCSNPEIARRFYVTPRTVSTHVEHILSKLGCASRAQLAAKAVSEGLLLAEDPRVTPVFYDAAAPTG